MDKLAEKLGAIKALHTNARLDKDQTAQMALGPLLGDLETKLRTKQGLDEPGLYGVIRAHINGLKECLVPLEEAGSDKKGIADAKEQIKILSELLPAKMNDSQILDIVEQLIKEGTPNMGKIMGHFKQNYPGQYDGRTLADLVKERMAELG